MIKCIKKSWKCVKKHYIKELILFVVVLCADFIKKSRYENLMKAINELSKNIKIRIKMFYFGKLTTFQIATLEHCSDRMIQKSLE